MPAAVQALGAQLPDQPEEWPPAAPQRPDEDWQQRALAVLPAYEDLGQGGEEGGFVWQVGAGGPDDSEQRWEQRPRQPRLQLLPQAVMTSPRSFGHLYQRPAAAQLGSVWQFGGEDDEPMADAAAAALPDLLAPAPPPPSLPPQQQPCVAHSPQVTAPDARSQLPRRVPAQQLPPSVRGSSSGAAAAAAATATTTHPAQQQAQQPSPPALPACKRQRTQQPGGFDAAAAFVASFGIKPNLLQPESPLPLRPAPASSTAAAAAALPPYAGGKQLLAPGVRGAADHWLGFFQGGQQFRAMQRPLMTNMLATHP
jgi:hypothetical protein